MILIPKRRFTGTPTEYGGLLQQTISEFKELNIGTAQIKDAAITTAKITDLAVTTAKIGLLAVTTATINDLAVTTAKIGLLAVTDATIDTLTVAKLTTGAFTATGTLTTSGVLKSANYVADTSGWQVDYAGNAEFNTVKVRGSIYTSSIISGNTLTVSGTISAGAGAVVLDSTGEIITGELLKFNYGATQYCTLGLNAANSFRILTSNNAEITLSAVNADVAIWANGAGSDIELDSDDKIYLRAGGGTTNIDVFANALEPGEAGTYDLGATGLYWDIIFYKTLSDQGCPLPLTRNSLETIRNIKVKKRRITIKDAQTECLGSRAIERIKNNPNKEFEEWDLSSFPSDLLIKPMEQDFADAERHYEKLVSKLKEKGKDWGNIKKPVPKTGIALNELVFEQTRAIQELVERLELLEKKV